MKKRYFMSVYLSVVLSTCMLSSFLLAQSPPPPPTIDFTVTVKDDSNPPRPVAGAHVCVGKESWPSTPIPTRESDFTGEETTFGKSVTDSQGQVTFRGVPAWWYDSRGIKLSQIVIGVVSPNIGFGGTWFSGERFSQNQVANPLQAQMLTLANGYAYPPVPISCGKRPEATAPATSVPITPRAFRAVAYPTRIDLSWENVPKAELYRIYYSNISFNSNPDYFLPRNSKQLSISNLSPNSSYNFHLIAINSKGSSSEALLTATTPALDVEHNWAKLTIGDIANQPPLAPTPKSQKVFNATYVMGFVDSNHSNGNIDDIFINGHSGAYPRFLDLSSVTLKEGNEFYIDSIRFQNTPNPANIIIYAEIPPTGGAIQNATTQYVAVHLRTDLKAKVPTLDRRANPVLMSGGDLDLKGKIMGNIFFNPNAAGNLGPSDELTNMTCGLKTLAKGSNFILPTVTQPGKIAVECRGDLKLFEALSPTSYTVHVSPVVFEFEGPLIAD